jgi:serine/threonine-protein kinase
VNANDPEQGQKRWVGRIVDGRYQVEALLGQGGMGVVLRARHQYTGQTVALKMLHPHLRLQGDVAARFLAEARAPAVIGHPGIVSVVDAGHAPGGELYLVMELLRGRTLAARLKEGPLPFEEVRRIGLELLAALHAAHGAGFIHRDLKPENVFLAEPGGVVKILDFGIAKVLAQGVTGGQTASGVIMGTVAYMSPEQLRDSSNVDRRTDLWAAGVIVYEMLAGRLPFVGDSIGNVVAAIMSQPPRPLRDVLVDVPAPVEQFLARALATDVHQRFGSAAEMAQALVALPPFALARRGALPGAIVMAPGAYPAAPTPAPAPTPSAMPAPAAAPAPAARKSAAVWVAVVAGLVAVGLAVALVLVLRGKGEPLAAAASPDAAAVAPAPTPVPVVVADAAPAPADAAVARPAPTPPDKPRAPATTKKDICSEACRISKKKCGITYAPGVDCVKECLGAGGDAIACWQEAGDDCDDLGACSIEKLCGDEPGGRATCKQTAACAIGCGNDPQCICGCLTRLSPSHTNETLRLFSCILGKCANQCAMGQKPCFDCVQGGCAAPAAACQ